MFPFMQEKGGVEEKEMFRTFNMGIGMVVVGSAEFAKDVTDKLKASGEKVYSIGRIIEGNKKVVLV